MTDQTYRSVLSVFIASPGDLTEEREGARAVVDELNRTLGRDFDIQIDLLGWEDTLPGVGRPQSLINADVDACDLFIGMLWKRWGHPSGEYTSGFEEEYVRARGRRRATGKPEMWLAFKDVDPDQAGDPGEQLQRVLAFKEAQRSARELLYKEFKDPDEWSQKLREWLTRHIGGVIKERLAVTALPRAGAAESSQVEGPRSAPKSHRAGGRPLPTQMVELAGKLRDALTQPDEDSYAGEIAKFDNWDAARLQLFAKALISEFFTHDVLEVHDINLLYRFRERVEFVAPEAHFVLRTVVVDASGTSPGWYWYRAMSEPHLETALFDFLTSGIDQQSKIAVLQALERGPIAPAAPESTEILRAILLDDEESTRAAGYAYVATLREPKYLALLDEVSSGAGPDSAAQAARVRLLFESDPQDTLAQVLAGKIGFSAEIEDRVRDATARASSTALRPGLNHASPTIRRIIAAQLAARGDLSEMEAEALTKDPSSAVRELGLRELFKRGRQFEPNSVREALKPEAPKGTGLLPYISPPSDARDAADPDRTVAALFDTYSPEDLKNAVDWYALDGRLAYIALAKKAGAGFAPQVRQDLREQFKRVRDESIERMRTRYGELTGLLVEQFKNLEDFLQERLMGAGMIALSGIADKSDLPAIREFLSKFAKPGEADGVNAALSLIEHLGDESDVDLLLQVATDTYGGTRRLALDAAIALSPGAKGVAARLVRSEEPGFIGRGLAALDNASHAEVMDLAYPLLVSDRIDVRQAAAAIIAKTSTEVELQAVLDRYLAESVYYYNVVVWLDRYLFAPEPLKTSFRAELTKHLR